MIADQEQVGRMMVNEARGRSEKSDRRETKTPQNRTKQDMPTNTQHTLTPAVTDNKVISWNQTRFPSFYFKLF